MDWMNDDSDSGSSVSSSSSSPTQDPIAQERITGENAATEPEEEKNSDNNNNDKKRPARSSAISNNHHQRKKKRDDANKLAADFYDLSDSLYRPSEPLYRTLPVQELDLLIGWANHITQPTQSQQQQQQQQQDNHDSSLLRSLVNLPSTPLPASILHYLIHECARKQVKDEVNMQFHHLLGGAFDQSALVSLGMCVEEMITAILLPLAKAHVQQCRENSEKNSADEVEGGESTFDQWTRPPEECILAMIGKDYLKNLWPPLTPPVRTAVANEQPWSILNQPLPGQEERAVMTNWAKAQGLEVAFMEENKDLFSLFQSFPPKR